MVLKRLIIIVWLAICFSPGFSESPKMTAERNEAGCIELFYIDPLYNLYHKKQNSPGGEWTESEFITGSVKSVKLIKDADDCLRVFYAGSDNALWCSYQELPSYEWTSGVIVAENVLTFDMILDHDESINLFYITTGNRLMRRYQISDDLWSGDVEMAPYAKLVAAGKNEDGRLELFYTLSDNTLNHKYQLSPGGTWSDANYFSVASLDLFVVQNEDGRMEVFFVDESNVLRHKYQVAINSSWSDHQVFATGVKQVIAAENHDGRIEVIYISTNDLLYHNWQTAVNNGWGAGEQFGWEAYGMTASLNEDGRLEVFYMGKDEVLFHNWQLQAGLFWAGEYPFIDEDFPLFSFEEYDTEPNYLPNPVWHVNDHCFIRDEDNYWHMFGIVYPDPYSGDPTVVNYFGHAGSATLNNIPWAEMDPPFYESLGEGDVLWAPHIIYHENTYYMFYCGGGELNSYEICLRTSPDLVTWSDYQVLFQDGIQGRDPMVLWVEEEQCWVMYYTATSNPSGGYHIVAYRTSEDLYNWSTRNIAYTDYHKGSTYGNTESPFVVNRGTYYYLFVGPRPYDYPTEELPNWEHPGYVGTDVYRSAEWNQWINADYVGHIDAHAPEIIPESYGNWYISHCGVLQGGLFIRRMYWHDGLSPDYPVVKRSYESSLQLTNVPNPFRSFTKIRYNLEKGCHLTIEILDPLGKCIKSLVDQNQGPGDYSIDWDGRDNGGNVVSPGLYVCQLTTGRYNRTLKMLFLGK
ncbi:MAG: family 43 glycosylhydrolase [Bacteroidales bacterium]|nr:family 43 glycosylhydrolase [Bacteroidales bacterium]